MDLWAGAVLLECEEGCKCRSRQYSLRHWNHVSLVYWKPLLEVSLDNGTNYCSIRVTNPLRNSTESKLKVCDHLSSSSAEALTVLRKHIGEKSRKLALSVARCTSILEVPCEVSRTVCNSQCAFA